MSSPLLAYLKRHGITQSRFAAETGWRQATISGWCNDVIPSIPFADEIHRATGGEVTVNDWLSYAREINKTFGDNTLSRNDVQDSSVTASPGCKSSPSGRAA